MTLGSLDPHGRGRAVAVRGRLLPARASRSRCCSRAGARVFHFDVGDGHFVEPVTIGPIVLESIAPLIHREGGVIDCHLMVDDPAHHFGAIQAAGADSVTFHYEVVGDPPVRSPRRRASAASRSGSRSSRRRRSRTSLPYAAGVRPRPLHEHPPRLLGPGVHAGGARPDPPAARRSARQTSTSRSTAGSRTTTSAASTTPAPT